MPPRVDWGDEGLAQMHAGQIPGVKKKRERWDKVALLFIAPYVVFCAIFLIYPTFMAIAGSFAKWNLITNAFEDFIGLSNYIKLMNDPEFWLSVRNSFIYFFVQIPTSIIGGMLVASMLNRKFFCRDLFRGLYFLPMVTGSVVVGIIFKWLLQGTGGVINYMISFFGIAPIGYLAERSLSMLSISLVKAWMDIGYYTVVFLAAYQSIPGELTEAAVIDGANARQVYFRIKIPLLNPTIIFCIMMATIWAFQLFTEPYVMTEGGPLGSSMPMTLFLYRQGFIKHNLSYASTIGVVVGLFILIISFVERKLFERDIF